MYEVQRTIRAKETLHLMPTSLQAPSVPPAKLSFAAARAHFDTIVDQLSCGPLSSATHAEIEEVLHREGLELGAANVSWDSDVDSIFDRRNLIGTCACIFCG
jgi:hypothetical protein